MRMISGFFAIFLLSQGAFADLTDDCSITDKTSCVLNRDTYYSESIVTLPNYAYCGVRFSSDTYPTSQLLNDFAAGLYVTAGPRWDTTYEQFPSIASGGNLSYPVGPDRLFITLFSVYTRTGESLGDYVRNKLATTYQPNPTVVLEAIPCSETM